MRLLSIALFTCLFLSPVVAQAPPTGSKRVNPRDGLAYVWISSGTFTMGCSSGDKDCYENELPPHSVTITKGFWIGQTEVTQAAYKRVMGSYPIIHPEPKPDPNAEPAPQRNPREPGAPPPPPPPPPTPPFRGPLLPAETMSWDEAGAYCKAVGMRLPTEAEWEFAARGGSASARYGALDAVAWYWNNSRSKTHNVALKKANGYGLYDTLGNVLEWVSDWYGENYYESSPATDPQGPASGEDRVMRGGSWLVEPRSARTSFRSWQPPSDNDNSLGVRCAGNDFPR